MGIVETVLWLCVVVVVACVILVGLLIALASYAIDRFVHKSRLIHPIAKVYDGASVRVRGVIRALSTVPVPFAGGEAVFQSTRLIDLTQPNGERIVDSQSMGSFVIDDGTGKVLVVSTQPLKVMAPMSEGAYVASDDPAVLALLGAPTPLASTLLCYRQHTLREGDEVVAWGRVGQCNEREQLELRPESGTHAIRIQPVKR